MGSGQGGLLKCASACKKFCSQRERSLRPMAQSMKPSNSTGAGCLRLFALPFCGAGLFCLYQFAKQLSEGSRDWEKTAGLGIAGLAFAGVGFGLVIMGRYG